MESEEKTDDSLVMSRGGIIQNYFSQMLFDSVIFIMKTHVRGFFDTDLHEVSWHFATHEAVRPSGF